MRKVGLPLVLVAALASPLLGSSHHEGDDEQAGQASSSVTASRAASRDARVEISNPAGSTRVIGWDRDEVSVSGHLGHGSDGMEFTGGAHKLRIEVDIRGNPQHVHSELEVHVPIGARLEIETYSANVGVSGIRGEVHASSVSGDLEVSGGAEEVNLETVSGNILVVGPSPRIQAEAVGGNVTIRGASAHVTASTVSGELVVEGGRVASAELETVSGRLAYLGEVNPRGRVSLQTVSGAVDLGFATTPDADFEVCTFSGAVSYELGSEVHHGGSSRHGSKSLDFTSGAGGATVSVQTLSGSIRIHGKEK